MIASDECLNLIKKYEGCHLTAYKCPSGVYTIGYGHTRNVKEGQMISQAEAEIYLREDIKASEAYVRNYSMLYNFNQHQFDALTSFCFNCGVSNLKKLLDGGHRTIKEISEAIPLYNKSRGKVLSGLVKRRAEEKALFDRDIKR